MLGGALSPALSLLPALDLDRQHALMEALTALVRTAVQPYEGTLVHLAADGFTVVFGVPRALEDHAHRAVLAAVALRQQWPTFVAACALPPETSLSLGLGLHTGPVVVGDAGSDLAQTLSVVGEVPLLAGHLAQQALPGTLLVSAVTARLVLALVPLEAQPPLQVANLPTPVAVYRLRAQASGAPLSVPRPERFRSQFVGRQAELAALHTGLTGAMEGRGQVVGIIGEPGMGKTRLLAEFRREVAAFPVTYLAEGCQSYGQATPYLPLYALVRQQCGLTETDPPEVSAAKVRAYLEALGLNPADWAPALFALLDLPDGADHLAELTPQAFRTRTFEALHQLFLQSSQRQPVVLEVENLHWIDPTSEACLAALVARLAGASMLVLMTYRPDYRPPWLTMSYATQITLLPLSPHDSQRVVLGVLGRRQVTAVVQQRILATAGGNPLFLEELAQAIGEAGEEATALVVPDTIHAVLAARIDRLAPATKHVLQTAAVIGREVPLALLQAVTSLSDEMLYDHLRSLQAAEFLYETHLAPEVVYTFKHALTQEVAYQSLLRRTRQQLHYQIVQALTERFPVLAEMQPGRLAHHYTEAGLTSQAIACWQQAGQEALERSANLEAISHLTRALALLNTLPQTLERARHELDIQTALGPALMATRGFAAPEVERTYARARELCHEVGDTAPLFPVLWGLWECYIVRGESRTARELGEQLLGLAQQTHDPARLLPAHYALGITLYYLGEPVRARAHLEQGIALYAPQQHRALAFRIGQQDPGVSCYRYASWTLWLLGYPDQALRRCQEALVLAREPVHPPSVVAAMIVMARLAQFRREVRQTREWAEASITLAREQGFAQRLAAGTILWGWALAAQGQHAEGLAALRQGLVAFQGTGAADDVPYFLALLAEQYGQSGQVEEGLKVLEEALALTHRKAIRWWEAELYRLQGELLRHAEGGLQSAEWTPEACFQQARDIARRQQARSLELRAAVSLARLWKHQGKRLAARQVLAEVYGWFSEGFDTGDLQEASALLDMLA